MKIFFIELGKNKGHSLIMTCFVFFCASVVLGGVVEKFILSSVSENKSENIPLKKGRSEAAKRPVDWRARKMVDFSISTQESTDLRYNSILSKLQVDGLPDDLESQIQMICRATSYESDREKVLMLLFDKWAESNFTEAMERANKLGPYAYNIKREMLIQLANKDPEAAFSYYQKNKENLYAHNYLIKDIAEIWSRKSPEKAWDWLSSLDGKLKNQVAASFFKGLDLKNIKNYEAYMDKASSQGIMLNEAIELCAGQNPEATMNWILNTKTPEVYMESAIYGMVDKDLNQAEEMLSTLSPQKQYLLVSRIAQKIESTDGAEAALNWTIEKISSDKIDELLLLPLSSWTSNYPDEPQKWIDSLPVSPAKDKATIVYSENLSSPDFFDDALDLMISMDNQDKKQEVIKTAVQKWKKRDSVEFNKWLENSRNASLVKSVLND